MPPPPGRASPFLTPFNTLALLGPRDAGTRKCQMLRYDTDGLPVVKERPLTFPVKQRSSAYGLLHLLLELRQYGPWPPFLGRRNLAGQYTKRVQYTNQLSKQSGVITARREILRLHRSKSNFAGRSKSIVSSSRATAACSSSGSPSVGKVASRRSQHTRATRRSRPRMVEPPPLARRSGRYGQTVLNRATVLRHPLASRGSCPSEGNAARYASQPPRSPAD